MEFPIQDIDLINNGINSLSHYFNKFFDFCKPIEIAEPLKNLFETYKGEVKYRTTENKKWLVLISEELFKLEYIAKTNGFFMLEGTKKQPNDFETYLNIYIDAYNLCSEIHDYFENVYPDEFSSWDDTTPVILTGIEYNNSQPQQTETKTDKLKAEMGKYGLFELPKVKQLSEPNKQSLVELISINGLPYSIAMFDFLGFLMHLENEHFKTKYKLNREVSKWFDSDKEGRAVKGNISSLLKNTTENKDRYTAYKHKENVLKDYELLK